MENTDASSGGNSQQQQPNLPPGFRFHPTDEELVVHYLKKQATSAPLPVAIIAEVDLYKFDPWELPTKATFGEQEWYFFSPRDRKYPNGARPNRAATSGYWKATGTDKPVLSSGGTQKVGVKKALVFYGGKPPKGIKTNWIMHEYRLIDNKVSSKPPGVDLGNKKNSLRLDDWVLCRIYKKNNTHRAMDHDKEDSMDDMMLGCSVPPSLTIGSNHHHKSYFPRGSSLYNNNATVIANNNANLFQGMLTNDGIDINYGSTLSQFASSSSGKLELPMKRAFESLYGTTEEDEAGPSNHHHHDVNGGGAMARTDENNNSFVGLLGQLPQTSTMATHQTATLLEGSSADGVFRQPYQLPCLNWYS